MLLKYDLYEETLPQGPNPNRNGIPSLYLLLTKSTPFICYSLSQNGWDTLGCPCPLNVGVQDLVTELR